MMNCLRNQQTFRRIRKRTHSLKFLVRDNCYHRKTSKNHSSYQQSCKIMLTPLRTQNDIQQLQTQRQSQRKLMNTQMINYWKVHAALCTLMLFLQSLLTDRSQGIFLQGMRKGPSLKLLRRFKLI